MDPDWLILLTSPRLAISPRLASWARRNACRPGGLLFLGGRAAVLCRLKPVEVSAPLKAAEVSEDMGKDVLRMEEVVSRGLGNLADYAELVELLYASPSIQ